MKIKCLIVDDEPLAQEVLETYIEWIDDLELVDKCSNALEAFQLLKKQSIDLIFLDIHMPRISGIDFLKSLPESPQVIFTTAYRDYALEGYELDIVDYLVKPISFDRFLKAVNKVYRTPATNGHEVPVTHTPSLPPLNSEEFIFLKADKKMVKVNLNDILYIESLKDYVRVKTLDKQVVTHQKISYLEEKLPDMQFMRIHRSFIVAVRKVDAFSACNVEVKGKTIPIGRNYKSQVLLNLNRFNMLNEA